MEETYNRTKSRVDSTKIRTYKDCIKTITLNVSEECQLNCSFCPRGHGYQSTLNFMDRLTAFRIKKSLDDIDYDKVVSISGMGEPFLNYHLKEILEILLMKKPKYRIQVLSNGMTKPDQNILDIYNMDIDIIFSIHQQFLEKLPPAVDGIQYETCRAKFFFRAHNKDSKDFKITNRAGYIDNSTCKNKCYYPFYKIFIDYDGSYLLCQDDWHRRSFNTGKNIGNISILEYFIEDKFLNKIRSDMIEKDTRSGKICKLCNANGIAMGEKAYEFFKKQYSR